MRILGQPCEFYLVGRWVATTDAEGPSAARAMDFVRANFDQPEAGLCEGRAATLRCHLALS